MDVHSTIFINKQISEKFHVFSTEMVACPLSFYCAAMALETTEHGTQQALSAPLQIT